MYCRWFADGWLGQGCCYLWLSAQVRFLYLGVVLLISFSRYNGGFLYRLRLEYESINSDVMDIM